MRAQTACRGMRGWLVLGALLLLVAWPPPAAGHDGGHALHLTDVRYVYRVPGAYQEVSFVVHNDEASRPTEDLRVSVGYVYTVVREQFALPELEPGAAQRHYLRIPDQVAAYGCVQAFSQEGASDPVCVATSGPGLG